MGKFRLGFSGYVEVTGDADFVAFGFEEFAETGVVDAVTFDNWDWGGFAVAEIDWRVVFGHVGQGGTFGGDDFELVPVFLEVFVALGSESFPDHGVLDGGDADFLFEEEGVESGLSAHADSSGDAGGLAGDGVFAARVGHVVMIGKPETGSGSSGTSLAKDAGGVDVPLFGFVAKELDGTGGIMNSRWEEFHSSKAVFNGSHTVALVQHGIGNRVLVLPSEPAAAMN
jgi:hypothetical protein